MDTEKYKVSVDGTYYRRETPEELIRQLEWVRRCRVRITVDYGNVETGESWDESFDVTGYVGRSMGPMKIPLLIYNTRSMGGGAMLEHCILSIRYANKKKGGLIYRR